MILKGKHYLHDYSVEIAIKNGMIETINIIKTTKDNLFIAPGFIDNQVNGYQGVEFSGDHLTVKKIEDVVRHLWKTGVTTFLPTIITSSHERFIENLKILAKAQENPDIGGCIPGFHLEGPYISPLDGFRGAHPKEHVRLPSWDEFQQYIEAANDKIIQVSVAPEVEGAIPFIKQCKDKGIVVALAHHNGSAEDIKKAVDAGATISTHLGNGCARNIDRAYNPLWPQLAEDRLTASMICDGFHLLPEQIKTFYKVKGTDRIILTSDIVSLAGLPSGKYLFAGEEVEMTPDGMIRNPETNTFAGASLPLFRGIENIIKYAGCSLADGVKMASSNYAKLFNLNDRGTLQTGRRADMVLFTYENNKIEIKETIVSGKVVFTDKE